MFLLPCATGIPVDAAGIPEVAGSGHSTQRIICDVLITFCLLERVLAYPIQDSQSRHDVVLCG